MSKKKLLKVSALGLAVLGACVSGALVGGAGTLNLQNLTNATEELVRAGKWNGTTGITSIQSPTNSNYTLSNPITGNVQLRLIITGGKWGNISGFNATNSTGSSNCTFTKFDDSILYTPSLCNMTALVDTNKIYFNGTLNATIPNDSTGVKVKFAIYDSSGVNKLEESNEVELIKLIPQFTGVQLTNELSPTQLTFESGFAKLFDPWTQRETTNATARARVEIRTDIDNNNDADNATIQVKVGDSWYGTWAKKLSARIGVDNVEFNSTALTQNGTVNATNNNLDFTLVLSGTETVPNNSDITIASIKTLYFNGNTNLKYEKTLASNLKLGTLTYRGVAIYIPNVVNTDTDTTYVRLQTAKANATAKLYVLHPTEGWKSVKELTLVRGMNVLNLKEELSGVTGLDSRGTAVKIFAPLSESDITCYAVIYNPTLIRRVPCLMDKGIEY